MSTQQNNKHISRLELSRTRGWNIRLCVNGQQARCLVSDSRFGGKERALEAARKVRDQVLEDMPLSSYPDVDELSEQLKDTREQEYLVVQQELKA